MTTLWVAAMTAAGLLLAFSAARHATGWRPLLSSLLKHDVLPYGLARVLARSLPGFQLVLASIIAVAMAIPGTAFTVTAGIGVATFFGLTAGYLTAVLKLNPAATCNCFGSEQPLGWFSVGRASLLAIGAVGYLTDDAMMKPGIYPLQSLALGTLIAAILALLPHAPSTPDRGIA